MFIKGDYNLKFRRRHDESPGEVLKFAMFKQEDIFRKQVRANNFLHEEAAFSLEEVDLSLSIGRNNQKEWGSSNSSLTNGLSRIQPKGNQTSHSSINFSTSFLEQNFFNEGVKQCKPAMGKPFPFHDGALLDLNIPLLEESSFHPNNIGGLVSSSNRRLSLEPQRSEVDDQTQEGASSLIYFMSECIREQCYTFEKNLQPECCDSFEANVLKLTECSVEDDWCVSSEPFEHKKDYGITLRRGRRMKDFRKEILPSLASLSRHEISEDMHLMQTILRSREYKKNRSKMKGRENQSKTVRNRRSR